MSWSFLWEYCESFIYQTLITWYWAGLGLPFTCSLMVFNEVNTWKTTAITCTGTINSTVLLCIYLDVDRGYFASWTCDTVFFVWFQLETKEPNKAFLLEHCIKFWFSKFLNSTWTICNMSRKECRHRPSLIFITPVSITTAKSTCLHEYVLVHL